MRSWRGGARSSSTPSSGTTSGPVVQQRSRAEGEERRMRPHNAQGWRKRVVPMGLRSVPRNNELFVKENEMLQRFAKGFKCCGRRGVCPLALAQPVRPSSMHVSCPPPGTPPSDHRTLQWPGNTVLDAGLHRTPASFSKPVLIPLYHCYTTRAQ